MSTVPKDDWLGSGLLQLSGLDRLRLRLAGALPLSPMHHMFGLEVAAADTGRATAHGAVSGWLTDLTGGLAAGSVAPCADLALGSAVLSKLPQGQASTTVALHIDYVRPLDRRCLGIRGEAAVDAAVDAASDGTSLARCEVFDDTGHRVAVASARCLTVPGHGEQSVPPVRGGAAVGSPAAEAAVAAWAQRPVSARRADALGPVEDAFASRPARPPAWDLLGLDLSTVGPAELTFQLGVVPHAANSFGGIMGGALALVADQVVTATALHAARHGTLSVRPLDLYVTFIRPALADSVLSAKGFLLHSGRRIASAACEIITADGRLAVVARGTFARVDETPAVDGNRR